MNCTILERIKEWLDSKEGLRHFLYVFFLGYDVKRDGDDSKVREDLVRYLEYQEHQDDPELKAFGLQYELDMKRDNRIRMIRSACNYLFALAGIIFVFMFPGWLISLIS